MNRRSILAIIPASLLLAAGAVIPSAAHAAPRTTVHPGESIQAALDAAPRGATVLLAAGTYFENLTITKPVTVRGIGRVVLRPSPTVTDNLCTEDTDGAPGGGQNNTGFCVLGELGTPDDGSDIPPVLAPVADVTIAHLRITGFHGQGVIGFGTERLTVRNVESDHNPDTGLFFEQGDATRIVGNYVHDNGHIAVRIADSRRAQALDNVVRSGRQGIFEIDSTGGRIARNHVSDTCLGVGFLDSHDGSTTGNVTLSRNVVAANNRFCAAEEGVPSLSGIGVALLGATGVKVSRNRVVGNVGSPDPQTGHPASVRGDGVLLMDATELAGGGITDANTISRNIISRNMLDVNDLSSGSNTFAYNRCLTASAPGICG